ncbi:uncharacterized protein LY89DRAFT_590826 [Mollisia scopiformis]|uniref:Uncharacterized protein n=1 Tax=Mollisia scopiformis TaxID=149040 RepID=A0A194X0Z3_MOLSC|nr:uncharacterized protein LY89DRAFT_590826 [Mollisia scopiformis]KUJ13639.1 hypothetical protein LY89DRAFT_590826 [Mollisia scopiformis]
MWERPRLLDDPFTTPSPETPPSTNFKWARVSRPARFSGLRFSPFRIGIALVVFGSFILVRDWIPRSGGLVNISNVTVVPQAAFQPPEAGRYRAPDLIDTFQSYKFRNTCNVSSLDLHAPFSPLCKDRSSMLAAMSSGGRIGHDAPYMPRECDMRWFTTDEICEILGRFDKVVLVGDSMLRHIIGSLNILIRKDLGYGAVTDWNFSLQESRKECFCNEQFNVKACSVQGIYKTADVLTHDPESLACNDPINVIMEEIVRFPVPEHEIKQLEDSIGDQGEKEIVFLFGHGLWSNLDLQKTVNWLDAVLRVVSGTIGREWHGLFITPNASGKEKPDEWIVTQGNKALMLFEEAVGIEAAKRGIEHLGTWNMSIQSNKYDGVHLDMRGNLVKAMMVLNWLNLIE